jgi:hypothetical protein
MSARVAGATSWRPFTTFETVGSDTLASAAIAARVVRRWLPLTVALLLGGTAPTLLALSPRDSRKSFEHGIGPVLVLTISGVLPRCPCSPGETLVCIIVNQLIKERNTLETKG